MVFDWYDHGRHATATIQPGELDAVTDPGELVGERAGEYRWLWYVQARDWVHDPDGRLRAWLDHEYRLVSRSLLDGVVVSLYDRQQEPGDE